MIFLVLIALALVYVGSMRLHERVAFIRTPDETHTHQLYKNHDLRERFAAQSASLSAIGISIAERSTTSSEPVVVIIRDTTNNTIITQQHVQASQLTHISIPIQRQSFGNTYELMLDAPDTIKANAVYIRYQSDPTKDSTSAVTQAGEQKQGSLGLTEYETPTRALAAWRWLTLPHQYPLWVGVVLLAIGIRFRSKQKVLRIEQEPLSAYLPYMLVILLACVSIYWPATHLFFYSDDVPILARIHVLWQTNPLLLLTPHRYTDADPLSQFGFDFYRPISFSIYPLILYLLIPTNAALYYFLNLLLFAGTGWCLFFIASHVLKSKPYGLLATSIWAINSTKLGLLYWWSSSQDLLASLFATLSIVLFILNRYRLSLLAFALGLFSKEYVIVTPVILLFLAGATWKEKWGRLVPYLTIIGLFLVVNTAMLGDPTLPPHKDTDQTYALSLSPTSIARNIVIYASTSVENRLWPAVTRLEQPLNTSFSLWQAKTSGPYYPGGVAIVVALFIIGTSWKHSAIRNVLLLSITWWVLFLGPILLFANDWKVRWLSLSLFGSGLFIAAVMKQCKSPIIAYILCTILAVYGYAIARDQQLTRFYREQSAYTQLAFTQLKEQEKTIADEQRIILVGITEDQKTSLNAYLFRVFAKNQNVEIVYADTPPKEHLEGDIIIMMNGVTPYYPDSEK